MLAAIDTVLRVGQSFERKADQYEIIGLPSPAVETVLEQKIVRHRVTGEKFIMKVIPHDAPKFLDEQARAEILALHKCYEWKLMAQLVDYFTDE